ncbi:helix-turn-helix domain-containing protein [Cryobacterium sp. MDB2-A-1]
MAFFTARASGASLRKSAALTGISRSTACLWLKQSGGVRPRATKPRPALRLSLDERETISRGLAANRSLTAIASELGRPVSTVSREVLRNSGRNGYRAAHAERLAEAGAGGLDSGNSPLTIDCASTWNPNSRSAGLRNRSRSA